MSESTHYILKGRVSNFISFMFIYICGFTAFKKLCMLLSFANCIFGHGKYNSMPMQAKRFRSQKVFKMLLLCTDYPVKIDLIQDSWEQHRKHFRSRISDTYILLFAMIVLVVFFCLFVSVLPPPNFFFFFFLSEMHRSECQIVRKSDVL